MAQTNDFSEVLNEYNDLFVSVLYIIVISLTAQFLRIIINKMFSKSTSMVRILAGEVVVTGEMCAVCFELGNVADNYGVEYYAVFYFLSSFWWAMTWGDSYACPNSYLEDYLNEEIDSSTAIFASCVELITACTIYKGLVRPMWSFGIIPIHTERLTSSCSADLSVRPLYGGLVEGVGTLLFSVISKIVINKISSNLLCTALNSLLDTALVVLAYDLSGGYFNPVLATSMNFGCEGASSFDHIGVYWASGLLGTLAALQINKYLNKLPEKEE